MAGIYHEGWVLKRDSRVPLTENGWRLVRARSMSEEKKNRIFRRLSVTDAAGAIDHIKSESVRRQVRRVLEVRKMGEADPNFAWHFAYVEEHHAVAMLRQSWMRDLACAYTRTVDVLLMRKARSTSTHVPPLQFHPPLRPPMVLDLDEHLHVRLQVDQEDPMLQRGMDGARHELSGRELKSQHSLPHPHIGQPWMSPPRRETLYDESYRPDLEADLGDEGSDSSTVFDHDALSRSDDTVMPDCEDEHKHRDGHEKYWHNPRCVRRKPAGLSYRSPFVDGEDEFQGVPQAVHSAPACSYQRTGDSEGQREEYERYLHEHKLRLREGLRRCREYDDETDREAIERDRPREINHPWENVGRAESEDHHTMYDGLRIRSEERSDIDRSGQRLSHYEREDYWKENHRRREERARYDRYRNQQNRKRTDHNGAGWQL